MYGFQKEFGLNFSYSKKVDRNECFGESKSSLNYIIFLATDVSLAISKVIIWDFGIKRINSLAFIVYFALTPR